MFRKIRKFFQPAPFIDPIQDPQKVSADYHYWRIRILYSMFIGYAFYYFTRKSFTFAMPGLIHDLNMDKSQLGILASIFSITYGISKFASGILSDRSNPRYFMAFGLFITGIINIFFGFSSSLIVFAILWGFNGWFQGFGWPPCTRFLTHWYSHSERGSWWSTCSLSHNVGAFIIPWIVGFCLQYFNWRWGMYIPGVICILGSFYLLNRLRDTPQSLGLPPIEEFRNDYQNGKTAAETERVLTAKEILFDYVLNNRYLWMLGVAYAFIYIVRTGIDWIPLYFLETRGYSRLGANGSVSMFEIGGFFGMLAAGWVSDRLFQARRGPINVFFAVLMLISILLFQFNPFDSSWVDSLLLFFVGFAVFGPQMLIGVAAAELSHKNAAASANGFVGCFAYIGAAVSGYPLGKITDHLGWNGFFLMMSGCSLLAILLLIPLWNAGVSKKPFPPSPEPEKEPSGEAATDYA